ncbi:hypothetical protein GOODEAATRI_030391 [Goodea atripinnis]|uniref:Uncharacterized protein n=1 Tax=Goodea atripinnis TaxID=208336 RepID=A0ABV0Q2B7_9TELE
MVTISPSGLHKMDAPSFMNRSLPIKLTGTGLVIGRVCVSPEKPTTEVVRSDNISEDEVTFRMEYVDPVSTRKGRVFSLTYISNMGSAVALLSWPLCGMCHCCHWLESLTLWVLTTWRQSCVWWSHWRGKTTPLASGCPCCMCTVSEPCDGCPTALVHPPPCPRHGPANGLLKA